MRAHPIKNCRICQRSGLTSILDLGILASCGVFPGKGEPNAPKGPLRLVQCDDCGLVQLADDYDGDDLFRHTYGYRSGLNESMVAHLASIVAMLEKRFRLKPKDIVLDIGANDGTLLSSYATADLVRVGIDPTIAKFEKYYQVGVRTVPDFFTAANFRKAVPEGKCAVITSLSMLYDLPDPNSFVGDVAYALRPEGVWLSEQSYLPSMVDSDSFDTICHEHHEYYGLRQLMTLASRHGLRIIDVTLNNVNGGSSQVLFCHQGASHQTNQQAIDALVKREDAEGYLSATPLNEMMRRIDEGRTQVRAFLERCKAEGKLVHGYGASTKGNTLLQYFDFTPELMPAIADRNADKFGARTPGTNIPIISEEESRALKPDYYFALPWHFKEAFLKRETDFIARGGRFVFPLPTFEILPKP